MLHKTRPPTVIDARYILTRLAILFIIFSGSIALKTCMDVQAVSSLNAVLSNIETVAITDRNGAPLTASYQNKWNVYDTTPLHHIPSFLQQAFILSEDKRFYSHHGVDWMARLHALWTNMQPRTSTRGASTITEQVIRMLHPRPRNLWSKWIEGMEAWQIERKYSKEQILEFYLNQVPYASNRRGVMQAARYYFNRDLTTLSHKEMLALVILARAPSSFDLYRNPDVITQAVLRLAAMMRQEQLIDEDALSSIKTQSLTVMLPEMPVNTFHFIRYVRNHTPSLPYSSTDQIRTTLDSSLQRDIEHMLHSSMRSLKSRNVQHAGVLVADHTTGEILAWVVAGAASLNTRHPQPGAAIDTVTVKRQPGSALKPFLYATALERGWTPATFITDAPLADAIGTGLHRFKNYSNTYYGAVTLREALANSLNIPALHTIRFVGVGNFLTRLHQLRFDSLNKGEHFYDEGLALGNGEVTLFELAQAYAALAQGGMFRPLHVLLDNPLSAPAHRVFSYEITSLIAHILSDPWARRLEFGTNSLLTLPVQTAIKTGTSTDYRDAWAVGFNFRYVIGIWMGNLDQSPMDGITGATGPAMLLRSVFSRVNLNQETSPLPLSPRLLTKEVCLRPPASTLSCTPRTEYFVQGTEPEHMPAPTQKFILARPSEGLEMAMDPRIPQELQKFDFALEGARIEDRVVWEVDGKIEAKTEGGNYLWPLAPGKHRVMARVERGGNVVHTTEAVTFVVK